MKATIAAIAAALLLTPVSSEGQIGSSRCADCHFANLRSVSRWHLSDWDHSAHGRSGVGCEKCHGGDPTTFEDFLAHQGILSARHPASPIHRTNLAKTCGSCHPGPFAAFKQSHHYELLREGNLEAPTCATCHGDVGAYLPSPKALYGECAECHAAGKVAPRADFPAEGQIGLVAIREVRAALGEAKALIGRVKDKERRASLEAEFSDARALLLEAVHAAHMFVFERMQDRLYAARNRTDLLMERLANPHPPTGK